MHPTTLYPTMEFHIAKRARDRYRFDRNLYTSSGNAVFPNYHAVRQFVHKMNEKRDLLRYPERAARAGEINGMGLIDEIFHHIVHSYREQIDSDAVRDALDTIESSVGKDELRRTLHAFTEEFPPASVYRGEQIPEQYLSGEEKGVSNREISLEEMLMLYLANENPAFKKYDELFNDSKLRDTTAYPKIIEQVEAIFREKPGFGPDGETLIEMLKKPARLYPDSLADQLSYIRERWGSFLGHYFMRLLRGLDYIQEEEKTRLPGPGPTEVYDYTGFEEDVERFTPDKEWMPHVVLIAKTAYVWLDQLSKAYNRPIKRLDDIPDEELNTLAHRGFTAVWLIGLWERSRASKRIKQICGNPEAEASAYSVVQYDIAHALGGWSAFLTLKERCNRRGIRLMGDMVPNHTGIDSDWVINHPDWFVQTPEPPYPSYTYSGVNLSDDHRVGLFIEDHYYDRTDAAVTFKWIDFYSGETRYIYHGNDGTSMPWNDTAQLNFLNPEAREAVIQTILHVARNFPIIRFDAAMTLAKRHFQRLWFPEPGSGGDIPSRAEYGMTKEEFNRAMPKEFWREVVDRVAEEAPDTLLLAEAFWMMEGYFVRNLGMHRVYNSAFMNMLKTEENAKYRETIKKTIAYDPGILNRFVNFLNNPDEDTALAQFGKEDKYFGVCAMMVTMPGLPMFGHGQVEGFAEKYGMEYSKAYWDEKPDEALVRRHEEEIFPLMKRRALFSGARNFRLYDVFRDGRANENVFAYSNRHGVERGVVLYNNKYEQVHGTIYRSAPYSEKEPNGEKRTTTQTLAKALGLTNGKNMYTVFREQRSGLSYIRNNVELHERGLNISLKGFEYQVFLDFFEVADSEEGYYRKLAESLGGAGFRDLETALKEVFLNPLHEVFTHAYPAAFSARLAEAFGKTLAPLEITDIENLCDRYRDFFRAASEYHRNEQKQETEKTDIQELKKSAISLYREGLFRLASLPGMIREVSDVIGETPKQPTEPCDFAALYLKHGFQIMPETVHILCARAFITPLQVLQKNVGETRSIIEELWFERPLLSLWENLGVSKGTLARGIDSLKLLASDLLWIKSSGTPEQWAYDTMEHVLLNNEIRQFLGVNRYKDILYFNKEAFHELVWLLFISETTRLFEQEESRRSTKRQVTTSTESPEVRRGGPIVSDRLKNDIADAFTCVKLWVNALDNSSYQVEKLLSLLKPDT